MALSKSKLFYFLAFSPKCLKTIFIFIKGLYYAYLWSYIIIAHIILYFAIKTKAIVLALLSMEKLKLIRVK